MFKCQKCGGNSASGETPTRVVLAIRPKEYGAFQRANGTHDRGGAGREIVREVVVHAACALLLQADVEARAPNEAVYTSSPDGPFNGVSTDTIRP